MRPATHALRGFPGRALIQDLLRWDSLDAVRARLAPRARNLGLERVISRVPKGEGPGGTHVGQWGATAGRWVSERARCVCALIQFLKNNGQQRVFRLVRSGADFAQDDRGALGLRFHPMADAHGMRIADGGASGGPAGQRVGESVSRLGRIGFG